MEGVQLLRGHAWNTPEVPLPPRFHVNLWESFSSIVTFPESQQSPEDLRLVIPTVAVCLRWIVHTIVV